MKLDIATYMDKFLDKELVKKYSSRKMDVFQKLDTAHMS